jgi:hypothetical protein
MNSIIGVNNPFGLIQRAGKRITRKRGRKNTGKRGRKTRKYKK